MEKIERSLREKEAAEMIGCAVQTLRNWRFQGKGPAYSKISGRLIIYRQQDLRNFLENHLIDPEAPRH